MPREDEKELKKLNRERTMVSELIAAAGRFLDASADAKCPKIKAECDRLIVAGSAMIEHHTKRISELLNGTAKAGREGR